MNKLVAWILGGFAGLAALGLLIPLVIGALEIVSIVLPATLQFQETAVVLGVLATFGAAIFVSNRVTKWLGRPSGKSELQGVVIHLRAGIRPLRLVRDLAIILALSAHYGLITGMTTFEVGGVGTAMMTIAFTNLLSMLVGFSMAGYLTAERRWTHLFALAFATWLVGLLTVVFFGFAVTEWMGSSLFILIAMGLGGSIATLLARQPPQAPPLHPMSHEIEFSCGHCGERLAIAADLIGHRVACGACGKASLASAMLELPVGDRANVTRGQA